MKPAAALANGAWIAASIPSWLRFRRALERPGEAQRKILLRLLKQNAGSAYGRLHGFGAIRSIDQFRAQAPVMEYADFEPWITRIQKGESNVLTGEAVTRLMPTGGSSGGRKLIPFTAGLQNEFNRAIGPWIVDLSRTHPAITLGPAYWSISPAAAITTAGSKSVIPIGFDDDSAYLGGLRQRLVEWTFAAPSALRLANSFESFRYLTLLSLLRQPEWSFASVWHPSFLALLLDALAAHWDELLADVELGGCRRAAGESAMVRKAVQCGPQPSRARYLRKTGPGNPHALWPRLRLVSCWGDGQAALALSDLQKRLPLVKIQPKGLLATEAFVTIPFEGLQPVAINSHFYEFVDSQGNIHGAEELQIGGRYRVLVTTAGGLWRYALGDEVRVNGFLEKTPSLQFVGRGAGTSDFCGEKLTESFVTDAIQKACAALAYLPAFVLLAPERRSSRALHYTLFVEGAAPLGLGEQLDQELRLNPQYALCRDMGQLGAAECFEVPHGAYERFCEALVAEGRRLGEIKPQSLSPRDDWRARLAPLSADPVAHA